MHSTRDNNQRMKERERGKKTERKQKWQKEREREVDWKREEKRATEPVQCIVSIMPTTINNIEFFLLRNVLPHTAKEITVIWISWCKS